MGAIGLCACACLYLFVYVVLFCSLSACLCQSIFVTSVSCVSDDFQQATIFLLSCCNMIATTLQGRALALKVPRSIDRIAR